MSAQPQSGFRCDVPSVELLNRLAADPLPLGLRARPAEKSFHRDVYYDTTDAALQRRGITCRLRYRSDDRRVLTVAVRGMAEGALIMPGQVYEGEVPELEAQGAFTGASEPARRLRAFVEPGRLQPVADLETERRERLVRSGWFSRPRFHLLYDVITVASGGLSRTFQELEIHRLRPGQPRLETLAQAFQDQYGLRPVLVERLERAQQLSRALDSESLVRGVQAGRAVAVIAVDENRIALFTEGGTLRLPVAEGSGEEACRHLLRSVFGSPAGQLQPLGTAPAAGSRPAVEVWVARRVPRESGDGLEWVPLGEVLARVGSPVLRDPSTIAALTVASRSDLVPEWPPPAGAAAELGGRRGVPERSRDSVVPAAALDPARPAPEQFINGELSALEFDARVLALAEDPRTPLLERLQFLSIFSSNLDEFFVVRVGALKQAAAEGDPATSPDGLAAQEQLDAIAIRVRQLVARQAGCFTESCLPALAEHGLPLVRWPELDERQRGHLRKFFEEQVFPVLTPRAITVSPGHPFPHIRNLALSLAVVVRDPRTGPSHFVHLRVPPDLPRFVPLPDSGGLVPIADVICANLEPLYPGRRVEQACAFRVTRSGDVQVDEQAGGDLLQAVEEEVRRRPFQAVVRLEVERAMPQAMRDLLLRELSFEKGSPGSRLGPADIYEIDGLLDLAALRQIAALPSPELHYPPFRGRAPLPADRSVFSVLAERDVLVHHPYDAFEDTVQRFLVEAADDPDVQSIKLTLYRAGGRSAIVEGLVRAAGAGKEVAVFVEVKARFDEQRNIEWAKKLEGAGIHVVYGLVELKNHAKVALVVRREGGAGGAGGAVRRYVHVGTGNYNAATARVYTDFGLLSADGALAADLSDLFNELTGSTRPPRAAYRRLLVAPTYMLWRFVELIDREADHARGGRGGRIRVKVNGVADTEVIAALYRASQAGVAIDLIVRGICCLRPGVPGLSERIRVISILGRFLEHGRIYAFGNGGDSEYYIGSADWRPRNLRRRVEAVAPVRDPTCRERLERILATELADPTAWELLSDGSYVRRSDGGDAVSVQEMLIRGTT